MFFREATLNETYYLFIAVAYLGDIALDEEDMRMFKVDRIVDAVHKTVINLSRTDTGKSAFNASWKVMA